MRRTGRGSNAELVLQALRSSDRPLSAYDLLGRLAPRGLASPITIYRALDGLVSNGSAHRLETLNAYIAVAVEKAAGHDPAGFVICDDCGSVEPLVDPDLAARLAADAAACRFTPHRMTVEVQGLCGDCRGDLPESAP